jgi:predicted Zn-ribbon and HTH transcriptional regulator
MVAMTWQKVCMEKLIEYLRQDYSGLTFREATVASWSPEKHEVYYCPDSRDTSVWSVLHELGHALLDHQSYESDVNLLRKETDAWEKAVIIAKRYQITIDPEHIQNCLDTYRDWLHRRSTCPSCGSHGVQQSKALYHCLNCGDQWKVSSSRFCRPYRLKMTLEAKKTPA